MKQQTIKKNIVFILLIGIEGMAFGLIDWDSVISDLFYIQHNHKLLISIIGANIGVARLIATLICIYINDSKKPNRIFISCVTLCAIGAFLTGIVYQLNWIILFSILYILEVVILEIYSGYHYAYVYHSLPEELATEVHSKRVAIFKITFMIGLGITGFFTTKWINYTMLFVTILSSATFLVLILFICKVKNFPTLKGKETISLREKLNLKNYTSYYKRWVGTRFLGKFALSSLVVLVSMIAIDDKMNLATLKTFKTAAWFFSSIGFWLSSYLIKNKMIIQGDILCKIAIVILIFILFFNPYVIYAILLLNGLLNPFNTMSNFTMIQRDKDDISVAQKELIINLFCYFSAMLSSYILLNIQVNLALIIIIITLCLSIVNEAKLYKENGKE